MARRATKKMLKGTFVTSATLACAYATRASPAANAISIGATIGAAFRTFIAFYYSIALSVVARANRKATDAINGADEAAALQAAAAAAAATPSAPPSPAMTG